MHRARRQVKVTARRTKVDWAYCMQQLADEFYPDAIRIRVVQDQLNTHDPAALYEVFEPEEAKRLLDRLEFHYTPKHGRDRVQYALTTMFGPAYSRSANGTCQVL